MTNIIDLNIHNLKADANEEDKVDLTTYSETKMVNLICLRLGGTDVLGLTDKAVDFDIIAFATISLKNPVSIVQSGTEVSLVPYFRFAKEVVATFNTTLLEAFIAQDKLPPEIINQYGEFTSWTPLVREAIHHSLQ